MLLKNKKTGEIGEPRIEYQEIYIDTKNHMTHCYKTLLGVFEEWEDYEEPKKYWFINASGEINSINEDDEDEEDTKLCKQIGNYFETKEEAEKAVEKLKALKRLKDNGLKITGYGEYAYDTKSTHHINIALDYVRDEDRKDLDLLFGGEDGN